MPYTDPILREFAGYLEAREPGRRERADAWATAIGLQKVDGLTPSDHLYESYSVTLSVVKEQSFPTRLVWLERNCSHYI